MKSARIYLRVSTESQSLERQRSIIDDAKNKGFYISGVYEEKSSATTANRPELQRLINDLQNNDYIIAERLDRITRLPPKEAEQLIKTIEDKGAVLLVPDVFYFDAITNLLPNDSLPQYAIEPLLKGMQKMFLRIALQISYDDWKTRKERTRQGIERAKKEGKFKGRPANKNLHQAIIELRKKGISINKTADLLNTSISTVHRAWKNRTL